MTDPALEQQIESAKREFDAAIGDPEAVKVAWAKLSKLVKQRDDLEDEARAVQPDDS